MDKTQKFKMLCVTGREYHGFHFLIMYPTIYISRYCIISSSQDVEIMDDSLKITQTGFLAKFIERHNNRPECPFCFVLGAGASKSSGIQTGQELASKWLKEIHKERDFDELPFEKWATPERMSNFGLNNFSVDRVGEHYSKIYEMKFSDQPEDGYACIEKIMEDVKPSYGYSVLAFILSTTQHKIVITTNFDNLVADALFLHSETFPRIIGHDLLVNYIRPEVRRPLIAKIHGDRGFATKSSTVDTACLSKSWREALTGIFKKFTPIFIGYAGNDGSLMGFIEELPDGVPETIYWCYRRGDTPAQRVEDLIKKKKGKFVEIEGFDEFMLRLQEKAKDALKFPDLLEKLKIRSETIVQNFEKQKNDLGETIAKAGQQKQLSSGGIESLPTVNNEKEQNESLLAVAAKTLTGSNQKKTWWEWWNEIKSEKNENIRLQKLNKALEECPENTADITGNYAWFLNYKSKDYDSAEFYYKKAIESDPRNADNLGNYAVFLKNIRKDYASAEIFYKKAIESDPKSVSILGNYANFLKNIQKDYESAEMYYKKAIEIDPKDTYNLGSYANLLNDVSKNYDSAEIYYKKAIEADPRNVNSLGNYANLLFNIRKDYNSAEMYLKKVIEVAPKNANGFGNYSQLLFIIGKPVEAVNFLHRAEECATSDNLDLRVELAFYRYAHLKENRNDSLCKLRQLLEQGARSPDWPLDENVERAIKDGHPEPLLLRALVRVIGGLDPIEVLDSFSAYTDTKTIMQNDQ
jgi:Tfp pilus assembly protein PilF/NAD-dependent SIR2 family protein deacetylase